MPVPPTAIYQGPLFRILDKRKCEISFVYETPNREFERAVLHFHNTESFKCTYLYSLGSIDRSLRVEAYGNLVSVTTDDWLKKVTESYLEYCKIARIAPHDLQQMVIVFDDGPCFEIICTRFELTNHSIHDN